MEKVSKKQQFRNKPYIDPRTGNVIKIGSKEYKALEKIYGEPNKVKSPTSLKLISVNKIAYKKLIKDGYTDQGIFENYHQKNMLLMFPLLNPLLNPLKK
jgi:hypothetical protein